MTGPRDWDKELAEIDKIMASGGGAAPSAPAPAQSAGRAAAPVPTAGPAARPATSPRAAFGVWLVALLGPLGAGALAIWPYAKACGPMLWVYLVGVLAVAGAGIWTMRLAWVHRRGTAHVVGLLTLLAALLLGAMEVLPRVGYAAVPLTWTCTT